MNRSMLFLLVFLLPIGLAGQCRQLGWLSCEASPNPNPSILGPGHWILYDFGENYTLTTSRFWNYNEPDSEGDGLRRVRIDYSLDGTQWKEWGEVSLSQASGDPDDPGEAGPDFEGLQTRYLLITALENHGGDCYGLYRVRFDLEKTVTSLEDIEEETLSLEIFPNPARSNVQLNFRSPFNADFRLEVINGIGQTIYLYRGGTGGSLTTLNYDASGLAPGLYHVRVFQDGRFVTRSFVKSP